MKLICSTCLEITEEDLFLYIRTKNDGSIKNVVLAEVLTTCIPILNLPNSSNSGICENCWSVFETFYKFREKCLETQDKIQIFLEQNDLASCDKEINLNCVTQSLDSAPENSLCPEIQQPLKKKLKLEGLEPSTSINDMLTLKDDLEFEEIKMESCDIASAESLDTNNSISRLQENIPCQCKRKNSQGLWSEKYVSKAIEKIKCEDDIKKIAKMWSLPCSLIEMRMKCSSSKIKSKGKKCQGRTIFSLQEEAEIGKHIKKLSKINYEITCQSVSKIGYEYAEKNLIPNNFSPTRKAAGRDWYYGFLRRNPDISALTTDYDEDGDFRIINKI